ncbi:hypothetical protein XU18_3105 [Perkinsela sp. CCAP 1560/4]|nr:hypothetical protein XU18_3105 [Perkinsela sp. CCAP 1560/4]|eukprot:KNH05943.1 hypothetical protein XU18_3105 [Perkinsela sp. CCAP 1560/4]
MHRRANQLIRFRFGRCNAQSTAAPVNATKPVASEHMTGKQSPKDSNIPCFQRVYHISEMEAESINSGVSML